MPVDLAKRWVLTYGSRVWRLLDGVHGPEDLGQAIGAGLFTREVDYLLEEEWAEQTADIIWRRTKLGLSLTAQEQMALEAYLQQARKVRANSRAA